jgi:ubiquinone/menaquinone biosynthesis C-methylase UbiE
MLIAHSQIARAPFDAVAARYDEAFTSSRIGQVQRAAVQRELAKTFHAGERVLEVGCGTGVDACFLAERGVRVVACDPSSEMIRVLKRRLEQTELRDLVQPCVLGAEELTRLPCADSFDGAFSNFGAINCVADVRKLAIDLARWLKPGASVLLCWMGPYCLWEQIWYLMHGSKGKAFRRLKRDGVSARIADGVFVHVRYPSVGLLARTFAPEFRTKSIRGIGVAVAPSYLEDWARRHPGWLQVCEHADSWLARCPGIRSLGDHVLVRLQRGAAVSGH